MKHAPSLVMLSLAEPGDCISKAFRSVSSCFSRLQTLSLRIDLGQRSIMLPESPELSSLKNLSLTIDMGHNSKILMDLTSLIERSPFLHRLKLRLKWRGLFTDYTSSMQKINKCPHPCLKVVKISGFIGSHIDTKFAMYLIENSLALEQLIFDLQKLKRKTSKGPDKENFLYQLCKDAGGAISGSTVKQKW
ncbi:F-box/LRR-repeat protein [Prunus yedoensis var. nudiflora]|uniref:F-box/LRR-repeat protein n=1 Tax=Prunus yedoensis var. nudiflora TaxID=2094558 RepID=A0A314Y5F2_PRUYE|nr:F-box/LRR-repeat protein [Prunus yedoensis var. nudiflora]